MPASYQAQTTRRFPLPLPWALKSEQLVKNSTTENPNVIPPKLLLKPIRFPFSEHASKLCFISLYGRFIFLKTKFYNI